MSATVAVVGLGSMGLGMARALRRADVAVRGADLSADALSRLASLGGTPAATPAEAARGCGVVLSVVVDAAQTEAILFGPDGCADAIGPDGVFVSCATMKPDAARALAARLAERGAAFLDAPMSGGAERAAAGRLTVLASGSDAAFARAAPALDAIAERLHRLGPEPGTGSAFKMVNQLLAGVHIAAACEAIAFAARHGLDLRRVYDVVTSSAGNSWMFENRVPHVLDGDYAPRSAVGLFTKDLGLVLDMARDADFPVPVAGAALQMFLMSAAAGMKNDDDASLARLYALVGGLALPGGD